MVGADGLRSVVRRLVDSTPMDFREMITHRTIAPVSALAGRMPNDRIRIWASRKLQALTLPIRGGTQVAIDAVIPSDTPPDQLWAATSADALLNTYADFDPVITDIIRARTVDVTTHPVYDKKPIKTWVAGRVVLLGDAAHPMAPMRGQGANQAIQDGGALAAALTEVPDVHAALARYQAERAPATAAIQKQSRRPNPALLKMMIHL